MGEGPMPRRSHKVRLSFLITWAWTKVRRRQKHQNENECIGEMWQKEESTCCYWLWRSRKEAMSQGMWEASKTGKGPQLTASKELGPRTAIQLQGTESTNNLSEEECRFSPRAFRNTTLQTPCWAHWTSDLQLLWDNYGCCFKLLNLWLLLNHKKQIHFPPVSISPITASSVFELCVC